MYFEPPCFNYERCMCHARNGLVERALLSVEQTPLQTRAGDARGHHPLGFCSCTCLRVCVRVIICVWMDFELVRRGLGGGRGLTCSRVAHQIYCVYIAVTAKSRAKMIQNTATICFITCKILTLKYKYLVLFIKRLWAGSAYSKSLQKSTLREIHYFFNSVPELGSNNVPCWYW